MGITTQGVIDFEHDDIDVSGSFVPAYQVNTILTQIPLVGLILSGGQHEGVFGVTYRVHGPMSGPTLTVNPLSAMAPGILHRILGAIDGTTTPRRRPRTAGRGRHAGAADAIGSHRPQQHVLLAAERQLDHAAGL